MSKTLKDLSVIAVTFFLLISLLSSCEKTQAQPTGDPAGIVKKNCTVCHNPQRICDSLGKKDRKEWDKTVKRMVDHGADISKQDIPSVVDYLTNIKPGSPTVCR